MLLYRKSYRMEQWPEMGLLTLIVKGKKKTQLVFEKEAELGLFIRPRQKYIAISDPKIIGVLKKPKGEVVNRIVSKIPYYIDSNLTKSLVSIMTNEGWTYVEQKPLEE